MADGSDEESRTAGDEAGRDSEPPRIYVSDKARARLLSRGGKLYVWSKDLGGHSEMAIQHAAFQPPKAPDQFTRLQSPSIRGSIELLIAVDLPLPPEIRVDLSPWPLRRVLVQGFGADWPDADGWYRQPAPIDEEEYT